MRKPHISLLISFIFEKENLIVSEEPRMPLVYKYKSAAGGAKLPESESKPSGFRLGIPGAKSFLKQLAFR